MKKILIALVILIALGLVVAYYLYNKPKTDYSSAKADININAVELFNAFNSNEQEAGAKYLNKVLAVEGTISQIQKNQKGETVIYLASDDPMFGIQITMLPSDSVNYNKLSENGQATLKGLCTGFANDVVLTNGSVENK